MEAKNGFTRMTLTEFSDWINRLRIARTVLRVQQHHTYSPAYVHFTSKNHFALQQGMKSYHVSHNGWADIGQHFTTFPDGSIVTGRSMEKSPACITGQNAGAVCIEHLGNFDFGKDAMTDEQRITVIGMTAAICERFNLPADDLHIVYHHWFDLSNGTRNNGSRNNKSCPGTGFFGGNKVQNFEANFLPLVFAAMGNNLSGNGNVQGYAIVTASSLNIRSGPAASFSKVPGREAAVLGSVLRVYEHRDGWCRISTSQDHWVSASYTVEVKRAKVTAKQLNIRSGPAETFPQTGSLAAGDEVFVLKVNGSWSKIGLDERWVKSSYLDL